MFLIIALFLLSAAAVSIWLFYEKVRRYPKGPTPLPIVGNLLSVNFRKLHEDFSEYSKIYSSVFTVWLPMPYVVITEYEDIKEAFAKKGDDFAGRTNTFPDTAFQYVENGGVIFSEGDNWKEQRRVSLHILRDFGMGKNLMEEQVLLSAQEFLAHMASIKNKEAMDLQHPIQLFIANVINKTLFGFTYDYDKSDRLMDSVNQLAEFIDSMKDSKLTFVAQMFPFMHSLPVIGYYSKGRFLRIIDLLKGRIKEDVEQCLKHYHTEQEPECFVHAYYQKMQTNSHLNYENLLNVCMDFFLAGMETTTTTLRWSALFLAKNSDAQDKIRQEILSVLGSDGKPSTSFRNQMPFTNAAICEIQRCANIVPLNVNHRTTKNTTVGCIPIPANTFVIGHIQHVMARSPVYKDSKEFQPERFLMADGVTPNKETVEQLCPFSIGKRQCTGEALAKVELFIGLVTIVQNYKIEPADGRTIDVEPIFANILLPKPQPLRLTPVSVY